MSRDEAEEQEALGSDLDQAVAMLEKAEIDHDLDEDDDGDQFLTINGAAYMVFDAEGTLKDGRGC